MTACPSQRVKRRIFSQRPCGAFFVCSARPYHQSLSLHHPLTSRHPTGLTASSLRLSPAFPPSIHATAKRIPPPAMPTSSPHGNDHNAISPLLLIHLRASGCYSVSSLATLLYCTVPTEIVFPLFLQSCYELASTPNQDESMGSELLPPHGNSADNHQQASLPRRISKIDYRQSIFSFAHTWEKRPLPTALPLPLQEVTCAYSA